MKFVFFGTPEIARIALSELKLAGLIPSLIVTNPDAPVGRKQIPTPPPTALWAKENSIPTIQPHSLSEASVREKLTSEESDIFVVVAYGKILPQWLLALPRKGTINLHPSLLPKLRGASPIRSAILNDIRETGVTIMLLDEKMDHGPILKQEVTQIEKNDWPKDGQELDEEMAHQGGKLLADTLVRYLNDEIEPQEQNHAEATFCSKISKEMSELAIDPHDLPEGQTAYNLLLKIKAFAGWPETFFIYQGKRIKIKSANLTPSGQLEIKRIVPEGKKEMDFKSYFQK